MANQDEADRPPAPAADDPAARVGMFRQARAINPSVDVGDFLPPPGSPTRRTVLVELIRLDLEARARAGLPTRLEPYLRRFAADLPAAAVPVALLYEEYRVRHRFADAPPVAEYKSRFPARYEEFRRHVERHPVEPPAPPPPPPGTVMPRPTGGPLRDFGATPEAAFETRPARITPLPPPAAPPPAPAARGDDEPDYKVLKVLGRGAYGKVFLAEAPGGVPVALKQILRGIDHPIGQSELEALEAIKLLSHPFLLQLHRFWIEGDQIYIAMDLAEGSLADRVDECKEQGLVGVPVGELVPFFAEAAEALDYLHSKNVTHRDVKPQNLLTLKGHAKLADLGLARSHAHSIQMTTVRQECGTPLFMAPEVWRKKVSKHSDQYALAASYAAARLGRPLYETEYIDQLIRKHIEQAPDLDPLPRPEQKVLLKALAKKPEDRYPSCKAFTDALREAAFPPPRPAAWPRRAILAAAAAGGCGLAYGLLTVFAPATNPVPVPPPPDVAWVPPGWEPAPGAAVVADLAGKKYYREVVRTVGGTPLAAELVRQEKPTDPPTFYMLRDKVTNRVFAAAWGDAGGPAVRRFNAAEWSGAGGPPLPGLWRVGATSPVSGPLGVDGPRADLPVLKVTAAEAALVADDLGGRLPSYRQWLQAVGGNGDAKPDASPFGDPPNPPAVAVNQAEPWPVTRETADKSPSGVRQLLSNGLEWTRDTRDGKELDPFARPPVNPLLWVVGGAWDVGPQVKTYADVRAHLGRQSYKWHNADVGIGFRVVLEQEK